MSQEPEAGSEDAGPAGDDDAVAAPAKTAESAAEEGVERLDRSWASLLATGVVGGIDVSIGVIALVLITERTGNEVIASLGFAIGFVALALAGSELITENFLIPVAPVFDGRRSPLALARLWGGTLIANLVGGGAVMVVFVAGWPDELGAALEIGEHSIEYRIGLVSFARAVVAGLLMTLMTWMQQGVRQSVGGRVIAAFVTGFLIIYTHSDHVVVSAFEAFAGLLVGGTSYGWGTVAVTIPWWLLGNLVGGLGLITVLRLVQARSS